MKEYIISGADEGQTLLKYLEKVLPGAKGGITFKALRKKNITLNNAKAAGKEVLKAGDSVRVFFSDDTIEKYRPKYGSSAVTKKVTGKEIKDFSHSIIYEDGNVLVVNKEPGLLSQGDASGDISLNDILLSYLENETKHYAVKPSVVNRLDRNTSGIVLCGKTQKGLKGLSELIRDRSVRKLYHAVVLGELKEKLTLEGFLSKDREENKVSISEGNSEKDSDPVKTIVSPDSYIDVQGIRMTLVTAELVTGKPHQIRAHLLEAGYPIIGDPKYRTPESKEVSDKLKAGRQLLHAYRVEFPVIKGDLSALSKKAFEAPAGKDFNGVLKYRLR